MNKSPFGGSTSIFWLVASSTTSVIMEKNSCLSPLITTNFPTPISSTLSRPSRRAHSPSTNEPLVMTPRRLREMGGIALLHITCRTNIPLCDALSSARGRESWYNSSQANQRAGRIAKLMAHIVIADDEDDVR